MRLLVSSENVSEPKMPTLRYGRSRSPSGHSSSFSMRRGTYETTDAKPFDLKSYMRRICRSVLPEDAGTVKSPALRAPW